MSTETRESLQASLPPGVRETLADDVVQLFDATASTIDISALAAVDTLDADTTPLTCGSDRLRRWEKDLGISDTRTALLETMSWPLLTAASSAVVASRWAVSKAARFWRCERMRFICRTLPGDVAALRLPPQSPLRLHRRPQCLMTMCRSS